MTEIQQRAFFMVVIKAIDGLSLVWSLKACRKVKIDVS